MTPERTREFYACTPLYFWPILWLEIRAMNRYLDSVALEIGEDFQNLIAISIYGTLHIISMSDNATGFRPADHWQNTPKITGDSLYAAYLPAWLTQSPHLRRTPESPASTLMRQVQELLATRLRPSPEMRNLGEESLYLDPG